MTFQGNENEDLILLMLFLIFEFTFKIIETWNISLLYNRFHFSEYISVLIKHMRR